jgi:hypothetical protein
MNQDDAAKLHDNAIIKEAAERMPMLLIGGFSVDNAILALYWALMDEEDMTHARAMDRTCDAIGLAFPI